MKIVGIIVEYNPMHNGHIYHLNNVREQSNADIIISVMSGYFTMRGDLSLFDKFTKTKQALENGVDIVVEFPAVLAINNSDIFALNAIKFLNQMGVSEIWIGSEENDPTLYKQVYDIKDNKDFNKEIKNQLDLGNSYKVAFDKACISFDIPILKSNDLLGYSYYSAIQKINKNIILRTIERKGDDFNSTIASDEKYTSAQAIRQNIELLNKYCPQNIVRDYEKIGIHDYEDMFPYMKYFILSNSVERYKELFFVEEGLENTLKRVTNYSTFDFFINSLVTKRYSKSRIKRLCFYLLFNFSKEDIKIISDTEINFVRILGFRQKSQAYLNKIKKETNIYTNIKEGINPIIDSEIKVTKILDYFYSTNNMDLEQAGPFILDDIEKEN